METLEQSGSTAGNGGPLSVGQDSFDRVDMDAVNAPLNACWWNP